MPTYDLTIEAPGQSSTGIQIESGFDLPAGTLWDFADTAAADLQAIQPMSPPWEADAVEQTGLRQGIERP